LDQEKEIVDETRQWLVERVDQCPAYASYLEDWGDWQNPWIDNENVEVSASSEASGQ